MLNEIKIDDLSVVFGRSIDMAMCCTWSYMHYGLRTLTRPCYLVGKPSGFPIPFIPEFVDG